MLTIHNFFAGEKNVLAVVIFHHGNDHSRPVNLAHSITGWFRTIPSHQNDHSRPDNSDGRAALAKASRNNGYDVANVIAPKEPP